MDYCSNVYLKIKRNKPFSEKESADIIEKLEEKLGVWTYKHTNHIDHIEVIFDCLTWQVVYNKSLEELCNEENLTIDFRREGENDGDIEEWNIAALETITSEQAVEHLRACIDKVIEDRYYEFVQNLIREAETKIEKEYNVSDLQQSCNSGQMWYDEYRNEMTEHITKKVLSMHQII